MVRAPSIWLGMRSLLVTAVHRTGLAGWRRRRWNKRYWDRQWGQADFRAPWLRRGISPEIIESLESGWLPASGSMLDIGCGEGEVAAYFAERGFKSVGIDISAAAIRRACERYPQVPGGLELVVHDLCAGPPPGGPFAVLVDRGCFHQIPGVDACRFAANVAAAAAPHARMLLFLKAFREGQEYGDPLETKRGLDEVTAAFLGHFAIERFQPTYLDPWHGSCPEKALPGLVFWMTSVGQGMSGMAAV